MRIAALLLLAATTAHAIDLPVMSGFDGADKSTTNTDPLEFRQCNQTMGSTCTGGDSQVDIQTTRVHDGGDEDGTLEATDYNSSRWSGLATVSSPATRSGFYTFCLPNGDGGCQDIATPRPTQLWVGATFNVDAVPATNKSRTILAVKEQTSGSDGDYGCSIAVNSDRTMTLFYAGGTSGGACTTNANCSGGDTCQGGTCRKTWGTSAQKLQKFACAGLPSIPCSVNGDCPNSSCSSTQYYWGHLAIGENITDSSNVSCEGYLNGRNLFASSVKTIAGTTPVQPMVNMAVGIVDNGGGTMSVDGAATVYFDDAMMDDNRMGPGYVARKVPSVAGQTQWVDQSCADHVSCVNDYSTSSYVYGNGAADTNNCVTKATAAKVEEYTATTPTLSLPQGATVTAIEGVVFGNSTATVGVRQFYQTLLIGDAGTAYRETCTRGPACTVNADCASPLVCQSGRCSDCNGQQGVACNTVGGANICEYQVINNGSATPAIQNRWVITSAPGLGDGSLTPQINKIGHRVTTGTSHAATVRNGAMLEYIYVQLPDAKGAMTLGDHATNGQDGNRVVMCVGDSTLTGVHEASCIGGDLDGQLCTQPDYCSWDPTNKAKPTGGCNGDNTVCRTCKGYRQYFNAGAGYPCSADADCNLTCVSNFCNDAEGPTKVPCTVEADCTMSDPSGTEAGSCDTTATCEVSCPGTPAGVCPSARTGWCAGLSNQINVNALIACGQDGEQMSEMYVNRFPSLLNGDHSSCYALSGSGKCTCGSGADCGTGGVCSGAGLCTSGDTTRVTCTEAGHCNTGGGRYCSFKETPPDAVITQMGYNEMNPFTVGDVPGVLGYHSPNCDTANAILPLKGCPTTGAGAWQKTATACTKDSECQASVAAESVCAGWALSGTDQACWRGGSTGVQQSPSGTTACSTSTQPCFGSGTAGNECGNLFTAGGPTCDGQTNLRGVASGVCRCTTDAQCGYPASGFRCVGDTGRGMCRKACPNGNSDCNTGRSSSCVTFSGDIGNGSAVCQGRCTIPTTAMTCSSDADCAPASALLTARYGNLTEIAWTGTCNLARGRCVNSGPAVCQQAQAPCTCTSDGECGTGGVCNATTKTCTAGDATRVACTYDGQCATGRQCLYPDAQLRAWSAYDHLPMRVAQLMQSYVDGLALANPPILLFMPPPPMGGKVLGASATAFVPRDAQCDWTSSVGGSAFYNRDYINAIRDDYRRLLAPHRVIDVTPTWTALQMGTALHSDHTHFSAIASQSVIAPAVATALNELNVCLKPGSCTCERNADCGSGGTCTAGLCTAGDANKTTCTSYTTCAASQSCAQVPQLYCMATNQTYGAGCLTDADCAGDICVARPCNGSDATCTCDQGESNCVNDVCGPD